MSSIQDHRAFYANFVVKSAGSSNDKLISAFSSTRREDFVGNGPWSVAVSHGYISTVSSDPRLLYQDIVVALDPSLGINNGQPTLHARCLAACAPASGDTVVHIGAGTGYYTTILASLVGPRGHVFAYEIEPNLAKRARTNLDQLSNVDLLASSASDGPLPSANTLYVNAGATHPLSTWLDALRVNGRIIFPLTPNRGFGVMLLVTRLSADVFAARVVSRAIFIPCVGARNEATSQALAAAIRTRTIFATKSLCLGAEPDATACYIGDGWWLSNKMTF